MSESRQEEITAVVSLYNPDSGVVEHCKVLLTQVGHVVAVDDGSPNNIDTVASQLRQLGCQVLRLPENSGIATALNTGIEAALTLHSGPRFILTMDQDSLLEDGYTEKLLASHDAADAAGVAVGMVAPGSISGLPTRRRSTFGNIVLGGEPIQSGLVIPVAVMRRLGMLMDELFIDGVDTEYYLRARTAGLESVVSEEARLSHALGTMSQATLFGHPLSLLGSPVRVRTAASYRYYYIFRNRLLLIRRYWRSQPAWAVKGLLSDYRHLIIVTLLAPKRMDRLRSMRKGVLDGFSGKSGPRRTS